MRRSPLAVWTHSENRCGVLVRSSSTRYWYGDQSAGSSAPSSCNDSFCSDFTPVNTRRRTPFPAGGVAQPE